MDLSKYYVTHDTQTHTTYIPGSKDWFVTVKPLNNREKKERSQLMMAETIKRPQNKKALAQVKDQDFLDSQVQYLVVQVRDFEYERCLVDFCLPYVPEGQKAPVNFNREGKTRDQLKKFFDNMPEPLETFIEDCISKANREGDYAEEAEETKNASEPLSEES